MDMDSVIAKLKKANSMAMLINISTMLNNFNFMVMLISRTLR
jgi:hypothetical protein